MDGGQQGDGRILLNTIIKKMEVWLSYTGDALITRVFNSSTNSKVNENANTRTNFLASKHLRSSAILVFWLALVGLVGNSRLQVGGFPVPGSNKVKLQVPLVSPGRPWLAQVLADMESRSFC